MPGLDDVQDPGCVLVLECCERSRDGRVPERGKTPCLKRRNEVLGRLLQPYLIEVRPIPAARDVPCEERFRYPVEVQQWGYRFLEFSGERLACGVPVVRLRFHARELVENTEERVAIGRRLGDCSQRAIDEEPAQHAQGFRSACLRPVRLQSLFDRGEPSKHHGKRRCSIALQMLGELHTLGDDPTLVFLRPQLPGSRTSWHRLLDAPRGRSRAGSGSVSLLGRVISSAYPARLDSQAFAPAVELETRPRGSYPGVRVRDSSADAFTPRLARSRPPGARRPRAGARGGTGLGADRVREPRARRRRAPSARPTGAVRCLGRRLLRRWPRERGSGAGFLESAQREPPFSRSRRRT
jgi:hypothetical protein